MGVTAGAAQSQLCMQQEQMLILDGGERPGLLRSSSIQFNSIQFNSIQFNSIQFKIICIALFMIQSLQSNFTGNTFSKIDLYCSNSI